MDSAPTLETVFQALNALYHNPDVTGKERASVWLGELQKSVFAWQIADQLLQLNHDVESCYFAAQTMRTKIQYAFHELPESTHTSLRDSLINNSTKVTSDTPPVISTQLCLALADLTLQMSTWNDAVQDLIQKYSNNPAHTHFLVELMTVLPEELNSRSLRLGANRRMIVVDDLKKHSSLLIQLLLACLQKDDLKLQIQCFRCLGSWFTIDAFRQAEIVQSSLLQYPFKVLEDHSCPSALHEAASDCVGQAIYSTEDFQDQKKEVAMLLYEGSLRLADSYHMSVAMEDLEKSINYCRVFTELAETFLPSIVEKPNQEFGDLKILELLLMCVGHHQYELADITFNFWYRLSEKLYQMDCHIELHMFKPYIHRLIVALCRHCCIDSDHSGIPNEKDEFGDFRNRVSELVKDVVFIIDSSTCFIQMFENLKSQNAESSWNESEAALFIMTAVAKNILPDENVIVPQVLDAVIHLPPTTHIALRYTTTSLIAELSEWIEMHPNYLEPVLQSLLSSLNEPPLASVAASSLQAICSRCQDQMTGHFTGLLQIVQSLDSFNVSLDAALGLFKGAALILSRMPPDDIASGMDKLCSISVAQLQKALSSGETKVEAASGTDPNIWLDRLAAVFKHVNPKLRKGEHPCKIVIEQIWPILSMTCDKYKVDVRVVERCCRCIRFAIRCLGPSSKSLLVPLVEQMVRLYAEYPHSCFLYLGSILVDEYSSDPEYVSGLVAMYDAFCPQTFKLLEESNGLRNHPDTLDDLFRLASRFIQKCPAAFFTSPMAIPTIRCAIVSCSVDHRDANGSVTKFFRELARQGMPNSEVPSEWRSQLRVALHENGADIVSSLINSCLFSIPSYMILESAEVLHQLLLFDREACLSWVSASLSTLADTGASNPSRCATQQQCAELHQVFATPDVESRQVSRALRDFCRFFR